MKASAYSKMLILIQVLFFASCQQGKVQPEVSRIDLQRHDLSMAGHEVLQKMIVFDPGSSFGKHFHPGEEIIYVAEGKIEYQVEGEPPVLLKKGEVLYIPAGTVHSARNTTGSISKELATYVVQKGKPLITFSN